MQLPTYRPVRAACATLPALAILLLLSSTPSPCVARTLEPRAIEPRNVPAPLSVTPAQGWDGIDGQWNDIALRVGTPPQICRATVSTASQQVWVVQPLGCQPEGAPADYFNKCVLDRGGIFEASKSSTFKPKGNYSLYIEQNLGYEGGASFGLDTVGLSYNGEGGPTISGVPVGAMTQFDFYVGSFGLHPKPTNWTNFTDFSPSYLTLLKAQNIIPSLSFGYTAGASYRFAIGVLSSLTLGGYDQSRFLPSPLNIQFQPDNERELAVRINSILLTNGTVQTTGLLPFPIYAFMDSTVPEIWLPIEACNLFEHHFGLRYDSRTDLYLISQAARLRNIASKPNVTFTLSGSITVGPTTSIVFPYDAFDFIAKPPYRSLSNDTRYFPLRRAHNDSQFVLGRTFFQEAYLTVDHERMNFSVAQVAWLENYQANLVPIFAAKTSHGGAKGNNSMAPQKSEALGTAAIAGVAVGAAAVSAGLILLIFYLRRWKQRKDRGGAQKLESRTVTETPPPSSVAAASSQQDGVGETLVIPKAELDASSPLRHELDTDHSKPDQLGASMTPGLHLPISEVEGKTRIIFEMEGDTPTPQEADSRQLTEKDAMRVREERYNGIDPNPAPPISEFPISNSAREERSRNIVSPGEVIELRERVVDRDAEMVNGDRNALVSPLEERHLGNFWVSSSPVASSPGAVPSPLVSSPEGSSRGEGTGGSRSGTGTTSSGRRRFSYE